MMTEMDARFRFENYVVGSANRLAVAASRAVAESPGTAYNPLFIYSGSGLGKTHLLIAIGLLARQVQPDLRVCFATLDEFVEELHAAVSSGHTDEFKRKYHQVELLLLDDVQFLAGRRETQSELLRLFNSLQHAGRQIVMTSDRPPGEISDLDERLITRFSGGLIVDIGAPDYETRVAIMRKKCDERGLHFETGVLEEVARGAFSNVRELQGALNKLIAHRTLEQGSVTVSNARSVLGDGDNGRPIPANGPAPNAERPAPANGTAPGFDRLAVANVPTTAIAVQPDGEASLDLHASAAAVNTEFDNFLSDMAETVAQRIEPWRAQLGEAVTYWMQLGYGTTMLERALEQADDPGAAGVLSRFEAAVERLRALSSSVAASDPELAASALFHDPERLAEAEQVAVGIVSRGELPRGPSPAWSRAEFEVGASNQLAVRAADAVVEEPGRRYNPLFLHGPSGVGKTHLLNAIGNELIAMSGGAITVACVNCQTFVDEVIEALEQGMIEQWRARYRRADVLILDGVQECVGKERSQEELFHVFNNMHEAGKQIVLSGNVPPRSLEGIEERLRSRFEGGLVVEIQTPDRALRERIFARCLTAAGAYFDQPLLTYLANRPADAVSDVVATAHRITQAAAVAGVKLSAAFAKRELESGAAALETARAAHRPEHEIVFGNTEKIIWDWPDVSGRAVEELR
ncbi:MAG: DnaA ATPase domain-containing protein [Gemmatimonadaceae bacterium]